MLGGILGAVTTPVLLPYTLTLAGVDVLRQPGTTSGSLYGTDIGSIHVTEQGPGGVSSMEFIVDDPTNALEGVDGAPVFYYSHAVNAPVFAGYADVIGETGMSVTGKQLVIRAVGYEARADWGVTPADVTIAAGTAATTAVQAYAAACTGQGALNVSVTTDGAGLSTIAGPIAAMTGGTTADAITIPAGTTLREGVRTILASAFPSLRAVNPNAAALLSTIDFYGGLRVMVQQPPLGDDPAFDYFGILVDNSTTAAGYAVSGLVLERQAASVRAVYVKGGNAAGSGLVTDGSGKPGATAYFADANITTAAARDAAGAAYLAQYVGVVTGKFTLENRGWPNDVGQWARAGGMVGVIDPVLAPDNINILTLQLMQIDKTFGATALLETWECSIGALPGSLASLMRALSTVRPN